jgi:hypothetical protein
LTNHGTIPSESKPHPSKELEGNPAQDNHSYAPASDDNVTQIQGALDQDYHEGSQQRNGK